MLPQRNEKRLSEKRIPRADILRYTSFPYRVPRECRTIGILLYWHISTEGFELGTLRLRLTHRNVVHLRLPIGKCFMVLYAWWDAYIIFEKSPDRSQEIHCIQGPRLSLYEKMNSIVIEVKFLA